MPNKKSGSITETDLAADIMGRNSLQGDDQERVLNERKSVPGVKREADGSIEETLQKSDKHVRATAEMGKGRGVHQSKPKDSGAA